MGRLNLIVTAIIMIAANAGGKTVEQLEAGNAKMEVRIESLTAAIEKQAAMLSDWKKKNDSLEKMNETLKKTRTRLQGEVVRMKKLLQAAGLNPVQEKRGDIPNFVEYESNWYSKSWFDLKYRDHRNSIAIVDDNPVDATSYPIASWFKVLQVLGNGDVLASQDNTIIRINGLPGEYIDGDRLPPNIVLIPAGTYQYINTLGSNKTIRQYTAAEVVNEEQFLHLIRTGCVFDMLSDRENILRARREKARK